MYKIQIAAAAALAFAVVSPTLAQTSPGSLGEIPSSALPSGRTADTLTIQVLLDRARISPGVIDGLAGGNTTRAIREFESANGLSVDGKPDARFLEKLQTFATKPILQDYEITAKDLAGPYTRTIPDDLEAQSGLERLGYTSLVEMLAERFHMSENLLRQLNPSVDFESAGTKIKVVAPRSPKLPAEPVRIEVDKAAASARAFAADGQLLASYPATIGSASLPSPSGEMEVRAIAPDPAYYFDPEKMSWGPDRKLKLAPGPNNPVGAAWIDLTKPTYGIHGTPNPALIGKNASHGCVRLTNWDAEELAAAVKPGAKVVFVSE